MFECVLNLSEGRDARTLDALADAAGASLRDRHSDPDHHRSVFTLINDAAALTTDVRALVAAAFERLDLREHAGVHPRRGVVDVVPFVALDPESPATACTLRDETARWIAATFHVPCFLYGPLDDEERTLPELRRRAFVDLAPDLGPSSPHPRLGATMVGCRAILVAWNLWLADVSLPAARELARELRAPGLRTLALPVGDLVQVSCNVVDATALRLSEVYDAVRRALVPPGRITRAELVGLTPAALLEAEDPSRLDELDLSTERTIESRI